MRGLPKMGFVQIDTQCSLVAKRRIRQGFAILS